MPVIGYIVFAFVFYLFTKGVLYPSKPPGKSKEEKFGEAFRDIVAEAIDKSTVMKESKGDKNKNVA